MMTVRTVPESLDPTVVERIDAALTEVTADGTRVAWAIESGSRAWGFPSPDSDYDCRFIYVRPVSEYLTPWPKRDVIEFPLDPIFDVNGWDLVKAVRLLLKGNAVVAEWLRSPIVYQGDPVFRDAFLELANEVADPARTIYHHLHVGRLQWATETDVMKLKRVLYTVRSAATLSWLRSAGGKVPPMDLPSLLLEADVPPAAVAEINSLIEQKRSITEAGVIRVPKPVMKFVETEFWRAELSVKENPPREERRSSYAAAEEFFRRAVQS